MNKPCLFKCNGIWNCKWVGGRTNPELLMCAIAWATKQNELLEKQNQHHVRIK